MKQFVPFLLTHSILAFTTVTPKALYHRTSNLAHKALIIFERPGAEESDYSIRSLQSEKKLVISTSVKNPDTGEWIAEDREIEGPIAYIETTTKTHLHQENETRCFELFIDDSIAQTERILEARRSAYRGNSFDASADLRIWVAAQRSLKPYKVIIPYVDQIGFPNKPLRVRRDFQRFLTLIEVSAVIHQYQREKISRDGIEYLVATVEDYAIAYELASVILEQTVKQISPKGEHLVKTMNEYMGDRQADEMTSREVVNLMGWDKKTVKRYLRECVDQGLIEENKSDKTYRYSVIRLPNASDSLLLDPAKLWEITGSTDRSNRGNPIQMGSGQINSLSDNGLPSSTPSDHGNQETKPEMEKAGNAGNF